MLSTAYSGRALCRVDKRADAAIAGQWVVTGEAPAGRSTGGESAAAAAAAREVFGRLGPAARQAIATILQVISTCR